ncbi:hypothetical protein [Natrarchaeobaculum sulfurireducens]|uniref:Uncharacterized protein n=1 Tax=Natrarchaeobaculum sulfurireducens TaxID=2044521 RepID=A0A346P9D1_9EURY|nr:hypothetical protein [Natrarchaeobaculum sulfurireducens]AXR76126.1 hypothetical protein AArc1_4009 [Natrarchaeobaculum sulfurireducens]
MTDFDRICSAQEALGDLTANRYPIFDDATQDKQVMIWQPSGRVRNLHELPSLVDMKDRAESFLQRAVESGCQLAVAPEWAYDISWIHDHEEFLFAPESPLFLLGCAPVEIENMGNFIEQLDSNYECLSAETVVDRNNTLVPQNDAKEFVTPTIIPIKAAARSSNAEDALLIQFKNKHMSGGINSAEERKLAEGSGVWRVNPAGTESELAVWTCSDVGDPELEEQMIEFGRTKRSYIVHVQCNPGPFDKNWTRFREDLFETQTQVTYISANWGTINDSEHCGYSGIYTKTAHSTVLGSEYDKTCQLGGLIGTRPECKSEYVCLLLDDVISKFTFARSDPNSPPAMNRRMANLKLVKTWVYNGDNYTEISSTSSNGSAHCRDWRELLDTTPLHEELIGAILRAEIDVKSIPDRFNPLEHLRWETLKALHGGETEEFGPLLCLHDRREPTTEHRPSNKNHPETIANELLGVVRLVEEKEEIELDPDFDQTKVPVNATYQEDNVPICLSFLPQESEPDEVARAKWLQEWLRKKDISFKPVVVVNRIIGDGQMKTLAQYEDATSVMSDPEEVDANAGLVDL